MTAAPESDLEGLYGGGGQSDGSKTMVPVSRTVREEGVEEDWVHDLPLPDSDT